MKIFKNESERNEFLINNLDDILWIIDLNLNTVYVSPSIEKQLGFTVEERMFQHPKKQLTHNSYKKSLNALFEELQKEKKEESDPSRSRRIEVKYYHKNGSTIWFENLISGIRDESGNLIGLHGVSRNITERKKFEEKLRNSLNTTEFYKDLLAHDMANVLNNIHSSINLLKMREKSEKISNNKKKLWKLLNHQIKRGTTLISNVRKLSLVDEEEFFLEKMDLKKLLKQAIKSLHPQFQDNELHIIEKYPEESVMVNGNNLLLDAFENILLNGCIHNDNEKICLWIEISKEKENEKASLKIEFKDNGRGITDVRKQLIFNRDHKKGILSKGMGIGLSLVSKIISNCEGRIWVENRIKNEETLGSNFIIILPKI